MNKDKLPDNSESDENGAVKIPPSQDRLDVLARIEEYEKSRQFDLDTENDPPWTPLDPDKIDYMRRRPMNKLKTAIANFMGKRYFNTLMRRNAVIFSGVVGLENLDRLDGGAIVTCNHIHQFDNYAVYLGLKKYYTERSFRLYKIVREGNYTYPGMVGFFMRHCNTLPINGRGNNNHKLASETTKAVGVLLGRGKKVLIYAEQGMWWNYRKPRPLKEGAFFIAAKFNSPVIPCFITMKDSDKIGQDGFPVQEFTLNILPVLFPDKNLTVRENRIKLQNENYEAWKALYERTYGTPLTYLSDEISDIDSDKSAGA